MHHRRMACFVMGLWIGGTLLAAYFVARNAAGFDELLAGPTPAAAKALDKIGKEAASSLLRYQASELNRLYVGRWEVAQMLLGICIAAILYLGTHVNRLMVVACGLLVVLTGFMHFVLTPEIVWLGRQLDFAAPSSGGQKRLWVLQVLYIGLEVLKFTLACAITGYLFVFKTRPGHRSQTGDAH
jgi:hypothetical protein